MKWIILGTVHATLGFALATVFFVARTDRIRAETEQQRLHFDQSKFIIELQLLEGAHAAPENHGSLSPSA